MSRRVVWVDAFTDRPLAGNPCAVVFDADDVDVETRIAFTRETRLSECSFLVASDKADFGARYYVASGEIKFAGHPTIATCAALAHAGLLAGRETITLEVGAGVISIAIGERAGLAHFTMTQLQPQFLKRYDAGFIAGIMGLEAADFAAEPQTVSTGTAFCIGLLHDHAALARAVLDIPRLEAVRPETDFFEVYLCTLGGFSAQGDTAARLLLTPPEPPEDPFTGSATGAMAAYLWHNGHIQSPRFVAEQGHGMGRPGRAEVEVLGPRDAVEAVRVGGSGVVVMDGALLI